MHVAVVVEPSHSRAVAPGNVAAALVAVVRQVVAPPGRRPSRLVDLQHDVRRSRCRCRSHSSGAPGKVFGSVSSQSPSQSRKPSSIQVLSRRRDPESQSLSIRSHRSRSPLIRNVNGSASSQSPSRCTRSSSESASEVQRSVELVDVRRTRGPVRMSCSSSGRLRRSRCRSRRTARLHPGSCCGCPRSSQSHGSRRPISGRPASMLGHAVAVVVQAVASELAVAPGKVSSQSPVVAVARRTPVSRRRRRPDRRPGRCSRCRSRRTARAHVRNVSGSTSSQSPAHSVWPSPSSSISSDGHDASRSRCPGRRKALGRTREGHVRVGVVAVPFALGPGRPRRRPVSSEGIATESQSLSSSVAQLGGPREGGRVQRRRSPCTPGTRHRRRRSRPRRRSRCRSRRTARPPSGR